MWSNDDKLSSKSPRLCICHWKTNNRPFTFEHCYKILATNAECKQALEASKEKTGASKRKISNEEASRPREEGDCRCGVGSWNQRTEGVDSNGSGRRPYDNWCFCHLWSYEKGVHSQKTEDNFGKRINCCFKLNAYPYASWRMAAVIFWCVENPRIPAAFLFCMKYESRLFMSYIILKKKKEVSAL